MRVVRPRSRPRFAGSHLGPSLAAGADQWHVRSCYRHPSGIPFGRVEVVSRAALFLAGQNAVLIELVAG